MAVRASRVFWVSILAALLLTIAWPAIAASPEHRPNDAPAGPGHLEAGAGANGGDRQIHSDRFIIEVAASPTAVPGRSAAVAAAGRDLPIAPGRAIEVLANLDVLVVEDLTDDELAALRIDPLVVDVQPDRALVPFLATATTRTGAVDVHASGVLGAGSTIAIIDTGVDSTHEALAGAVVEEACFSSGSDVGAGGDCPDGSSEQIGSGAATPCTGAAVGCSHGTHVAAAAAGRQTGASSPGTAPGASILAIRVFDEHGSAAWLSDVLKGLDWALSRADDVDLAAVNLSLGYGAWTSTCDASPYGPSFLQVTQALSSRGVLTVAAAGNDGRNQAGNAAHAFPACLSSVVSVSALGRADAVADYSNLSPSVDLLAPGRLRAAVPGGYATYQGTSMASPQVAGAVALLREVAPGASAAAIRSTLRESGTAVDTAVGSLPLLRVDQARNAPGRPGNVAATRGNGRATVAWSGASRRSGSRVQRYHIVASPGGRSVSVNGSARSATITGLTNGTRYTFTVRAENRLRRGAAATSNLVIPKPTPPHHRFPDVSSSSYYDAPVRWLRSEGITTGYGTTGRYEPHRVVTRGQMAAFLHRTFDEPRVTRRHGFSDVDSGAYYDDAVRWLSAEGITTGYGNTGRYEPGRPVTRGQMAAFLWRAAGRPSGYPAHGFPDVASGAYYDQAVRWLTSEGLTTGYGTTGRYEPDRPVTRAQMAAFLHRLASEPSAWHASDGIPSTIMF